MGGRAYNDAKAAQTPVAVLCLMVLKTCPIYLFKNVFLFSMLLSKTLQGISRVRPACCLRSLARVNLFLPRS